MVERGNLGQLAGLARELSLQRRNNEFQVMRPQSIQGTDLGMLCLLGEVEWEVQGDPGWILFFNSMVIF